mmetsp:Transcript_34226/g.78936  ORF Transcript_34226/g.78936 Transcript_34226/m.78936 type:complete len:255 (-) Transcript_34226:473-1237(-)
MQVTMIQNTYPWKKKFETYCAHTLDNNNNNNNIVTAPVAVPRRRSEDISKSKKSTTTPKRRKPSHSRLTRHCNWRHSPRRPPSPPHASVVVVVVAAPAPPGRTVNNGEDRPHPKSYWTRVISSLSVTFSWRRRTTKRDPSRSPWTGPSCWMNRATHHRSGPSHPISRNPFESYPNGPVRRFHRVAPRNGPTACRISITFRSHHPWPEMMMMMTTTTTMMISSDPVHRFLEASCTEIPPTIGIKVRPIYETQRVS